MGQGLGAGSDLHLAVVRTAPSEPPDSDLVIIKDTGPNSYLIGQVPTAVNYI